MRSFKMSLLGIMHTSIVEYLHIPMHTGPTDYVDLSMQSDWVLPLYVTTSPFPFCSEKQKAGDSLPTFNFTGLKVSFSQKHFGQGSRDPEYKEEVLIIIIIIIIIKTNIYTGLHFQSYNIYIYTLFSIGSCDYKEIKRLRNQTI